MKRIARFALTPVLLALSVLLPNPQIHADIAKPQAQTAVPFNTYTYISPYGYARGWCGTLAGTLNLSSNGTLSWSANTSSLLDIGQGCTEPIVAYPGDVLFLAEVQYDDVHNPFIPWDDEWVTACSSLSSSPGFINVTTQYTSGNCTTSLRGTFRYRLVALWRSLNDNYGWKVVQAYSGVVNI